MPAWRNTTIHNPGWRRLGASIGRISAPLDKRTSNTQQQDSNRTNIDSAFDNKNGHEHGHYLKLDLVGVSSTPDVPSQKNKSAVECLVRLLAKKSAPRNLNSHIKWCRELNQRRAATHKPSRPLVPCAGLTPPHILLLM